MAEVICNIRITIDTRYFFCIWQVMMKHLEDGEICTAMPKPLSLAKRGNRARQKLRPAAPTTRNFVLDSSYIPADFLRDDIKVDDRRHLVFATDTQLSLLKKAKTWYIDATFKVVKEPFNQLFTIHAFIR